MKHDAEYPEFAVSRETLSNFFSPPLAKSTFYDLVNRGKVFPVSGVRGYYRLNASLRKLGMSAVKQLPDTRQASVDAPVSLGREVDLGRYPLVLGLLNHFLQRQMNEGWLTPFSWEHGAFPTKRKLDKEISQGRALYPGLFS